MANAKAYFMMGWRSIWRILSLFKEAIAAIHSSLDFNSFKFRRKSGGLKTNTALCVHSISIFVMGELLIGKFLISSF
jgi:hypothetical protein